MQNIRLYLVYTKKHMGFYKATVAISLTLLRQTCLIKAENCSNLHRFKIRKYQFKTKIARRTIRAKCCQLVTIL